MRAPGRQGGCSGEGGVWAGPAAPGPLQPCACGHAPTPSHASRAVAHVRPPGEQPCRCRPGGGPGRFSEAAAGTPRLLCTLPPRARVHLRQTHPAPRAPLESGVLWVLRPVTTAGGLTQKRPLGSGAGGLGWGQCVSCLDQRLRLQVVSLCPRLPCACLLPSMSLQDTRLRARALSEARMTSSSPDPESRLQRAFFQEDTRGQGKDVSLGITIQPMRGIKPGPPTPPRAHNRGCGPHTWGGQCRTRCPESPAPTKGAQPVETAHRGLARPADEAAL